MKKLTISILVIAASYTACSWDYYLSRYMFKKICNDPEQIGLFVYEQVELEDKYLIPFPDGVEQRDMDPRFILGNNLIIDRDIFDRDYLFEAYQPVQVTRIGPINYIQTSVIRRSDGKLLGKAVGAGNSMGWLATATTLGGGGGDTCPSGQDKKGFSYFNVSHKKLVKSIFSIHHDMEIN